MGPMFATNKELCNGKMSDIFYGKLKMCFNKTTSNSGYSWERKNNTRRRFDPLHTA